MVEQIKSGFKFLIEPLEDIVLTYVPVVILSTLIFIILLFLRKVKRTFYILSTTRNLIVAVSVFNMYKYALTINSFEFLEYYQLCAYILLLELYNYLCIF